MGRNGLHCQDEVRAGREFGSLVFAIDFYMDEEDVMGKYFIAWLLGVPLFVLMLIYLIF